MNKQETMHINRLANRCGYFFNAYLDAEENFACNNGYNCKHPEQEETNINPETGHKIGKCYAWSCPLAVPAYDEDEPDSDIDFDDVIVQTDESGRVIPPDEWEVMGE